MLDACLTSVINFGPFPRQQIITRRTKLKTLHSFQTLREVKKEKKGEEKSTGKQTRAADEGGRQAGRQAMQRKASERERERDRALGLAWSVRLTLQSILPTVHYNTLSRPFLRARLSELLHLITGLGGLINCLPTKAYLQCLSGYQRCCKW
jgi:hypothetical protein